MKRLRRHATARFLNAIDAEAPTIERSLTRPGKDFGQADKLQAH
jgi:hypothetical protein